MRGTERRNGPGTVLGSIESFPWSHHLVPGYGEEQYRESRPTRLQPRRTGLHALRESIECRIPDTQRVNNCIQINGGSLFNRFLLFLQLYLPTIFSFIDENNPNDYIGIRLGLNPTNSLNEKRVELLSELNLPKTGEWKVLPSPKYISKELLAFVRVFNMDEDELDYWLGKSNPNELFLEDCGLSPRLNKRVWAYLQTRLNLLLRQFPQSLEEDKKWINIARNGLLKINPLFFTDIGYTLLLYRASEKRILTDAMNYAKGHVSD